MKITREQLIQIGHEVASGWGGECYEIQKIKEDGKTIYRFLCIEFGEHFYTDLTEEEIKEDYGYCLE